MALWAPLSLSLSCLQEGLLASLAPPPINFLVPRTKVQRERLQRGMRLSRLFCLVFVLSLPCVSFSRYVFVSSHRLVMSCLVVSRIVLSGLVLRRVVLRCVIAFHVYCFLVWLCLVLSVSCTFFCSVAFPLSHSRLSSVLPCVILHDLKITRLSLAWCVTVH
jgi:hypothetical protein